MVDLDETNFNEKILKNSKVVLDFWAPWCGPCIKFKPIFEKVAEETKDISFGKVNVETQRELAMEHNVMSIPTVIFFKDGKEVGRFTGSMEGDSLKSKIKEYLG